MKKLMLESNFRKKFQTLTFLVIVLVAFIPDLYSQSLIEDLGGVKTNFIITTDSVEMTILEQAIIKRGVRNYKARIFDDGGYGYGYGLQTFHLELITKAEFVEKYRREKRSYQKYYTIKLFDKKDTLLLNKEIELSELKKFSNGDDLFIYSLDLRRIPIILLDKTTTINIDKIKKGKKQDK